jgi:hypothetical protein
MKKILCPYQTQSSGSTAPAGQAADLEKHS